MAIKKIYLESNSTFSSFLPLAFKVCLSAPSCHSSTTRLFATDVPYMFHQHTLTRSLTHPLPQTDCCFQAFQAGIGMDSMGTFWCTPESTSSCHQSNQVWSEWNVPKWFYFDERRQTGSPGQWHLLRTVPGLFLRFRHNQAYMHGCAPTSIPRIWLVEILVSSGPRSLARGPAGRTQPPLRDEWRGRPPPISSSFSGGTN